MTSSLLTVGRAALAETLNVLQAAGDCECVVLWLASSEQGVFTVKEVYRPPQRASQDYFEIPRAGMVSIMDRLRTRSLSVAVQIHTHPGRAFHSAADERWAIVRHVGALSIVIPYFARHTTAEHFFDESAVFRMDPRGQWQEITTLEEVLVIGDR